MRGRDDPKHVIVIRRPPKPRHNWPGEKVVAVLIPRLPTKISTLPPPKRRKRAKNT